MQLRPEKDMTKQWLCERTGFDLSASHGPEDEAVQCSELRRSSMTVFASPTPTFGIRLTKSKAKAA